MQVQSKRKQSRYYHICQHIPDIQKEFFNVKSFRARQRVRSVDFDSRNNVGAAILQDHTKLGYWHGSGVHLRLWRLILQRYHCIDPGA